MITESKLVGHKALILENSHLKVTVLPEKGADIPSLVHSTSGTEFLMQTPWGLKPPSNQPPEDFLTNYEGGWQELFPNAGDGCEYRGEKLPFHGEVALLPWDFTIESASEEGDLLKLRVKCQQTPFLLERTMRLPADTAVLEISEKVTNLSDEPVDFVWGHHVVLGGSFLEDGCQLKINAGKLWTPPELYEPETARLAPGQFEPWPMAIGRSTNEQIDLREIPGPDAHSHDDVYLTDIEDGRLEVENPRVDLTFALEWDPSLFQWVVAWQPYGGAEKAPLTGIYGLGVEPWVTRRNLAEAIEHDEAVRVEGHGTVSTTLRASVKITPDEEVSDGS